MGRVAGNDASMSALTPGSRFRITFGPHRRETLMRPTRIKLQKDRRSGVNRRVNPEDTVKAWLVCPWRFSKGLIL
jgi:hypothetical protein